MTSLPVMSFPISGHVTHVTGDVTAGHACAMVRSLRSPSNTTVCVLIYYSLGFRIFFFSILSIKWASTTYMNPFDIE